MNDSEMRILFAAFAMLKMKWDGGEDEEEAKECFAIADAMVKASKPVSAEDTLGIVAIKKKRAAAK